MAEITHTTSEKGLREIYALYAASFHPKSADFFSFEGFKALCSPENAGLLSVTTAEKQVVGYILFRNLGEDAELLSLAVEKTHQKQGVGKKLLEATAALLKKAGCRAIFLEVSEKNQAARALYQSFGANRINTRKDYYTSPKGTKEDALIKKIPLR